MPKRTKAPCREVRGVAHEYWIERRRARLQARRRAGGPYRAQGTSQEKKENKILDPWA